MMTGRTPGESSDDTYYIYRLVHAKLWALVPFKQSDDYSTDEEYLNTIAGAEGGDDDDDEEEQRMMKEFEAADADRSGNISLGEFIKLTRGLQEKAKINADAGLKDFAPRLAERLDKLEHKMEENNRTLRKLCDLMEASLKTKADV